MTTTVRAGVFDRESKGKDSSIADQARENLEAADELGATVVVHLHEKVSGSRFGTKARDGWPEVIKQVEGGLIDLLILWEISRGDRVMDSWVPFVSACRDHNVKIHVTSAETTYDPTKAAHRKALLDAGSDAEHETEKLSTRTRKGTTSAAMQGRPHGQCAYGFIRRYDPTDRRKFRDEPDPETAPIVRAIFEKVAREVPLKAVVDELNEAGIPAAYGGPWGRKSLKRLIRSEKYIGLRRHGNRLYPGQWPALVSERVFQRACAVLADPDRKASPPGAVKYLLSYVASCGSCKATMNVQPPRQGRAARYRCLGRACTSVEAAHLDAFVAAVILERLAMPDARQVFAPDDEHTSRLREAVATCRDELADLAARVGRQELTLQFATMAEPGIQARLDEALAGLKRHTANAALLDLLDSDDLWATWKRMPVAAQRSVVKGVGSVVTVAPTDRRLSRFASDEDRLSLVAERATVWP